MPGVPKSRGCNTCRRQKKKARFERCALIPSPSRRLLTHWEKQCDEGQPACSRCARLGISCKGVGIRRYKFQNLTVAGKGLSGSLEPSGPSGQPGQPGQSGLSGLSGSSGPPRSAPLQRRRVSTDDKAALAMRSTATQLTLALPPSSTAKTHVTGQLVAALEVLDPRFDLTVYGDFVRDLPRRYGSSAVLDAAANAMAVSLPLVHAGWTARPTEPMLRAYGHALQALRFGIGAGAASTDTANTLCALYLIVVCQGWMQNEDELFPSHGEAVASILHSVKGRNWTADSFERKIITTLLFLVIMESYINPRIRLDPDLWGLPETFGPRSAVDEPLCIDSLSNRRLARAVTLIRAPRAHLRELVDTYACVLADRSKLAALLDSIPAVLSPDGVWASPLPISARRMQVRWQTGLGMLDLLALRLNGVLQATPGHNLVGLPALALESIDSIITLAGGAIQYRPLGSSCMPLCLVAAYAALSPDEVVRCEQIRGLLAIYRPGLDMDGQLADMLATVREKSSSSPQTKTSVSSRSSYRSVDMTTALYLVEEEQTCTSAEMCCIL